MTQEPGSSQKVGRGELGKSTGFPYTTAHTPPPGRDFSRSVAP